MENCDVVFSNVTSGLAAMDQLREIIDPSPNDKPEVTFKDIPILAEAFERYRWPTTMALQGKFYWRSAHILISGLISRCYMNQFCNFLVPIYLQVYSQYSAFFYSSEQSFIRAAFSSCLVFLVSFRLYSFGLLHLFT